MDTVQLPQEDIRRLLAAANPDAALLYLYLASGQEPVSACDALRMTVSRYELAAATLRQMGLWTEPVRRHAEPGEAPAYTEADVMREMRTDPEFPAMIGEVQRRLGRVLSTEELKILLSVSRYLGLPSEVITILVNYCIERARARSGRTPSLRTIEKEAYRWADNGIDTMEEAAVFLQNQLQRQSATQAFRQVLGVTDRRPSATEEKMLEQWADWGFGTEALQLAYDRTCMAAGGLKWNYLHAILRSWHEKGLHTVSEIQTGDTKPARDNRRGSQQPVIRHDDSLTDMEREAIARMMQKGLYDE